MRSQTGTNTISFGQFCQLLDAYGLQVLPRGPSLTSTPLESNLAGLLRDLAISEGLFFTVNMLTLEAQELEEAKEKNKIAFLSYRYWAEEFDWTVLKHLLAGGVAGGVSRTVVSPFERMKILFQVFRLLCLR